MDWVEVCSFGLLLSGVLALKCFATILLFVLPVTKLLLLNEILAMFIMNIFTYLQLLLRPSLSHCSQPFYVNESHFLDAYLFIYDRLVTVNHLGF